MIILPNSHYLTYTFLFKRLGERTFWTKGLNNSIVYKVAFRITCPFNVANVLQKTQSRRRVNVLRVKGENILLYFAYDSCSELLSVWKTTLQFERSAESFLMIICCQLQTFLIVINMRCLYWTSINTKVQYSPGGFYTEKIEV